MQARGLGRPNHVSCIYNVPLRQIAARQFGHWMFAAPGNLLLEQAVHPLSQIAALAGAIGEMRVLAGTPLAVAPRQVIHPTLDAVLRCEHLPASLRFAVGQAFPFWQISVVCDDGVAVADILANRFYTSRRTRWLDTLDGVASAGRTAAGMLGGSARNTADYGMSLVRLKPRSDAFFQSMRGSIAAFHAALDAGRQPELDGAFGAMLVDACERILGNMGEMAPAPSSARFGGATPDQVGGRLSPASARDVALPGARNAEAATPISRSLAALVSLARTWFAAACKTG